MSDHADAMWTMHDWKCPDGDHVWSAPAGMTCYSCPVCGSGMVARLEVDS